MSRVLFIADCHLDTQVPHIIKVFGNFLETIATNADALYILGDLMDYWIGDDDNKADSITQSLQTLSQKIPVYFMHGNRDFLIGKDFAKKSGITILKQPKIIKLNNKPTLIMHGDVLCTDDYGYQYYRTAVQNPVSKWLFRQLTLKIRQRIATRLRQKSITTTERKRPEIMDVNLNTVKKYMQRYNVTQLIHGHTHRPAIHKVQTEQGLGERIVLGDWYQRGNYLLVTDKQTRFIDL